MSRIRSAVSGLSVVCIACAGEGVDVQYTRSNCPWSATSDFASAGFRLYHQLPSTCPWPHFYSDARRYASANTYYSAIVTAPYETNAATLSTSFFNDRLQQLQGAPSVVFRETNSSLEAQPQGYYQAATVFVAYGETRTDYAQSIPYPGSGYGEVRLTYVGTPVVIVASREVAEHESFTLLADVASSFEPVSYAWYQDDVLVSEVQSSQSSNQYTTALVGSGMTVVFRVEVTNANNQVMSAKHRVDVPAKCGNPPCPAT